MVEKEYTLINCGKKEMTNERPRLAVDEDGKIHCADCTRKGFQAFSVYWWRIRCETQCGYSQNAVLTPRTKILK